MKHVFDKLRELITNNFSSLIKQQDLPKMLYIDSTVLRESILEKHSNFSSIISEDKDQETVLFIVTDTPSPYVDELGKLYVSEADFYRLVPYLVEFFSSNQRGVPLSEAFNILMGRLTLGGQNG